MELCHNYPLGLKQSLSPYELLILDQVAVLGILLLNLALEVNLRYSSGFSCLTTSNANNACCGLLNIE